MRFDEFMLFDEAATAIFPNDSSGQHHCRKCLNRLTDMARRYPGIMSEAAKKDVRKGVAFKSKELDDLEHGVFARRLARRLWQQPGKTTTGTTKKPNRLDYGDFLHHSVLQQGEVLGDMQWEAWEITKKALELGGVDPNVVTDPNTTLAERMALVGKINWQNVTLPRLKTALGPSFRVPEDWRRAFAIERLKRIKTAVEKGEPIMNSHEQKLLGIWRTLEIQLGGEEEGQPSQILPADSHTDVGQTRTPTSLADRRRLYHVLTGNTTESVEPSKLLQLSPQSAYYHLTQYGVDVVRDEEATDIYLTRILQDLRSGNAFIPSSARGSDADGKRWRDSAARSWGGFISAGRGYDPANAPGVAQWITGMTTRGHKTRVNPSGRRVPYAYNEPEEFKWPGDAGKVPPIKYVIDVPSKEIPNEDINAFYRAHTPESEMAVQQELVKPARDAVMWLKNKGWIDDASEIDDYTQDVVVGMLGRTGSVPNWRTNLGFRRSTASMLARRFASQGWPSATKERSGQMDGAEVQSNTLSMASPSNRQGGEDAYSRVQGGAARARATIQNAIAAMLDIDTSNMGAEDEGKFVDAIDSLSDPKHAARALDTLDKLSARHASALPQVRHAVDRIQQHLEPLMAKVRVG